MSICFFPIFIEFRLKTQLSVSLYFNAAVCIPHLRRLLLLLLGCVLQAPRKEEYISTIEMLPESVQTIIMQCFEEVGRGMGGTFCLVTNLMKLEFFYIYLA